MTRLQNEYLANSIIQDDACRFKNSSDWKISRRSKKNCL